MALSEVINLVVTGVIALLVWSVQRNVAHMDNAIKSLGNRITDIEQKYNDLRADLPLLFVTREDYVRTLNAVDTKLDKQDSKLDRLLLKMGGDKNG